MSADKGSNPREARRRRFAARRVVVLGQARDGQPVFLKPTAAGGWQTGAGQIVSRRQMRAFLRRLLLV